MPWTQDDIVQALYIAAQDKSEEAYTWVASNENAPTELLKYIWEQNPSVCIKYKIVNHNNVSEEILLNAVKKSNNIKLLIAVLCSPQINQNVFEKILSKRRYGRSILTSWDFKREMEWSSPKFQPWVKEKIESLLNIKEIIE